MIQQTQAHHIVNREISKFARLVIYNKQIKVQISIGLCFSTVIAKKAESLCRGTCHQTTS